MQDFSSFVQDAIDGKINDVVKQNILKKLRSGEIVKNRSGKYVSIYDSRSSNGAWRDVKSSSPKTMVTKEDAFRPQPKITKVINQRNVRKSVYELALDVSNDVIFSRFMPFLLGFEGGYADLKGDAGGKTMYGIASKFNPLYAKQIQNKTLPIETAIKIYYDKYYKANRLSNIKDPGLRYFIFDSYCHGTSSIGYGMRRFLNSYGHKVSFDKNDYNSSLNSYSPSLLSYIDGRSKIVDNLFSYFYDNSVLISFLHTRAKGQSWVRGFANRYRLKVWASRSQVSDFLKEAVTYSYEDCLANMRSQDHGMLSDGEYEIEMKKLRNVL